MEACTADPTCTMAAFVDDAMCELYAGASIDDVEVTETSEPNKDQSEVYYFKVR